MFGLGKLKFRDVNGKKHTEQELVDDYNAAEPIGRVRYGKLGMFYRDLGKKYFVEYPYIERAFIRVSECHPDDSPAYYYYRLILVHGEKEFANLIFNEEAPAYKALDELIRVSPSTKKGYVPPADGKRPARFC